MSPHRQSSLNKISAMSIHFPRAFDQPLPYKEVIARDGYWISGGSVKVQRVNLIFFLPPGYVECVTIAESFAVDATRV